MRNFYFILFSIIIPGILFSHTPYDENRNEFTETLKFHSETIKSSHPAYYFFNPTADCDPLSEFSEDFNSTDEGEVPDCWNTMRMNSSSGNVDLNVKSNPNAITPPHDFQFNNSTDDNATFYLVTPELSTLSNGTHRLRFYYDKNGNDNVQVEVGTMSNASSSNTFNSVSTISPGEGYNVYTVDFDQETTDSYVAFKLSFSIGFSRVHLDNVSWEPVLDCSEPTDLSFDGSGETSADLSWSPGGEETQWIVKYGEQGFDLETEGETQEVSNSPNVSLTDLNENTQYQAYVKAICATDEESVYAGPINFYTGYCPGTAEGGSGSIDSFSTTGGYENINNQNTGSDSGYEDYTDMIVSQTPDNDFDFSANTTSGSAGFAIYIDYNQDFTFDSSEKAYTSNGYQSEVSGTINIPEGTAPGEYRLRVVSNWLSMDPEPCHNGNLGEIEDYTLIVLETSECTPPESLSLESVADNSADISWTAGADETQWEVIYGDLDFDPDSEGSSETVNDSPNTTLTGLSLNTEYEVYVKAKCDSEDSQYASPISFSTACGATNVPFTQDFESVTPPEVPTCATLENDGDGNNWKTTVPVPSAPDFTGNALTYGYNSNTANAWFFTQGVELTAGVNYQISYKYSDLNYVEKLKISYGTSAQSSAMTTELADHTTDGNSTLNNPTITFNVSTDGVYYFGFNAHSDANQNYLYVDDIHIDVGPTCPEPSDISLDNITDTSADVTWNSGANDTSWEITYGESGFNPVNEGTTITVDNYSNTSLTDLSPQTNYDLYIKADCDNEESNLVGPISFLTLCTPAAIPFEEGFENGFIDDEPLGNCWTQEDVSGSSQWHTNNTNISFNRAPRTGEWNAFLRNDNENWIFYPLELTGGTTYQLTFYARQNNTSGASVSASYGTENSVDAMIDEIIASTDIIDGDYQKVTNTFTPDSDGIYYMGIKGELDSTPYYLSIDDISVTEASGCPTPTDIIIDDITSTSANVSWMPSVNETEWEVLYDEAGFNPENEGTSITIEDDPNTTLDDLDPDMTYDVYVRAVCGEDDFSDWAGPVNFTTEEEPVEECEAPTDVEVNNITDTTADVSWTPGGEEMTWAVIYGESGFTEEEEDDYQTDIVLAPNHTLENLIPETDYDVYVFAICDEENMIYSDIVGPITFLTDDMSMDSQDFTNFTYYPNPVENQLSLKAGVQIENVQVFNLLGQNVISVQPNSLETQINTDALQSGVYLMKVSINGSQKTFRVVKK